MKIEFEIPDTKFQLGDCVYRKNNHNDNSIIMVINEMTITGKWKYPGNTATVLTGVYTCIIQGGSFIDKDRSEPYEIDVGTITYAAIDYVDQNFEIFELKEELFSTPSMINDFIVEKE